MEKELTPFKPIAIEDRELINGFTHRFNTMGCEYSFANLFCWREIYDLSWTLYRERLLIHDGVEGYTLMPLGPRLLPRRVGTWTDRC